MQRSLLAVLLFTGAVQASGEPAPSLRPERIVSLNLCADELVLRLADKAHIASVTWLSRQPQNSTIADIAETVPVNHGSAEEVFSQRPDLVLAGRYTTRATVTILKRFGIPVVELDAPQTLDEARAHILHVATLLGERPRGEAMVAELDERLSVHPVRPPEERPGALVLQPNGFTVRPGSLVDSLLVRAGAKNLGAEIAIEVNGPLPLEAIATSAADILIVNGEENVPPALAMEFLHHPVLSRLPHAPKIVSVPPRLWTCGGPAIADAVDLLAEAIREAATTREPR